MLLKGKKFNSIYLMVLVFVLATSLFFINTRQVNADNVEVLKPHFVQENNEIRVGYPGKTTTLPKYFQFREFNSQNPKTIKFEGRVVADSDTREIFSGLTTVTRIEGINNLDTSNLSTMDAMFNNSPNLTSIEGLEDLDVSNVKSMQYIFYNDFSLNTLNVSNWNTHNVQNFNSAFQNLFNLTSFIGINNLNVSNAVTMTNTFYGDYSIKNLELSNWKVNVPRKNMYSGIFANMINLESLNISNLTNTKDDESLLTTFNFTASPDDMNYYKNFTGDTNATNLYSKLNTITFSNNFNLFQNNGIQDSNWMNDNGLISTSYYLQNVRVNKYNAYNLKNNNIIGTWHSGITILYMTDINNPDSIIQTDFIKANQDEKVKSIPTEKSQNINSEYYVENTENLNINMTPHELGNNPWGVTVLKKINNHIRFMYNGTIVKEFNVLSKPNDKIDLSNEVPSGYDIKSSTISSLSKDGNQNIDLIKPAADSKPADNNKPAEDNKPAENNQSSGRSTESPSSTTAENHNQKQSIVKKAADAVLPKTSAETMVFSSIIAVIVAAITGGLIIMNRRNK
ncbi:BspA family leucine-rich repeat surface protein [Leuconostoc citreum]|uniref:BspA family leucine-rich repeat surface protein n=1 Tax=Leuconostoc citreum TaxID=33964 RepID=UPI002009EE7F|nr:BspA family leucine-rich repeat surface protein [Leuconostoc citreum]MCK8606431.1 BspA family leucine-rich repeat surface protein [Leuconostoc citreum]